MILTSNGSDSGELALQDYVLRLEQAGMGDVDKVGGKNASLGEMIHQLSDAGVRVPGGFATTALAYRDFLAQSGLADRINEALNALDADDTRALIETGGKIRQWIMEAEFQPELDKAINDAWAEMTNGEEIAVAVRSSAARWHAVIARNGRSAVPRNNYSTNRVRIHKQNSDAVYSTTLFCRILPPILLFLPHPHRERDDVPYRIRVGQQHHETVNAEAHAAGGGHPAGDGMHEVHVHRVLLVIFPRVATAALSHETLVLLHRVGQLAVGVAHLERTGVRLEALHEQRVATLDLGQGRDVAGMVADEAWCPQASRDFQFALHDVHNQCTELLGGEVFTEFSAGDADE